MVIPIDEDHAPDESLGPPEKTDRGAQSGRALDAGTPDSGTPDAVAAQHAARRRKASYIVRYLVIQFLGLGMPWFVGISGWSLALAAVTYAIGMFGVTAGYHRFFSHRTYKTSRWFAVVLAVMAEMTAQKGVIWWARGHRHHHRYSDTERDLHSPISKGFAYAHVGWLFDTDDHPTGKTVADLERRPELVWLDKHWLVPPIAWGVVYWLFGGWEAVFTGYFFAVVLLHHGTFTINSLSHVWGTRTYDTIDSSRNNFFLALITFGEGWHNNHHHYMRSTRQGFEWWQLDITYLVLRGLAAVGIVWDLREPTEALKQANRLC
jgi:stearoyl-CoA desaturase (delta-9 desaturase)